MKKAKKPVGTKLAVKKSLTKPKRDVEDHYFTARSDSHRLEIVADELAQTAERLAKVEVHHPYANEHAEVPTAE